MGENGLGTAFGNTMQQRYLVNTSVVKSATSVEERQRFRARVRKLGKEAQERGLDPNVWFGTVEQIASECSGRETVSYACKLVMAANARRAGSIWAVGSASK